MSESPRVLIASEISCFCEKVKGAAGFVRAFAFGAALGGGRVLFFLDFTGFAFLAPFLALAFGEALLPAFC
jgi:hypothetical protein